MNQELDNVEEWIDEGFTPFGDIEDLEKDDLLFNEEVYKFVFGIENPVAREKMIARLQVRAKELKVARQFGKILSAYEKEQKKEYIYDETVITFNGLENNVYRVNRYEMLPTGQINEVVPNVGKFLVCYHPIVPVERYRNIETGTEKIKLAYFIDGNWNYIIVDKSTISSPQSIIKLSDVSVGVTSENAKYLIKYLSEVENMNRDKIKTNISVSRLGWVNDKLIPYNKDYEFDNENDIPFLNEKFGTSGTLEDWVNFFKERRKYNSISRIIMAGAVTSILLKDIKQSGFTIHIWGESEFGKTVACLVGQSIFGNPSQADGKGIGINFNFTSAGLEYRLNLYNNIPLFINEMQHQKDAKDYDKILFLISEGKGKSRSTKTGGIGRENSWNNVVITNGEKNIIKDNSNAGAYNRCISCEITEYSYENLSEVADFAKENYGTVIREILAHLKQFNLKEIYKEKLELTQNQEITNKQKILEALILTGDKVLTDLIFKDEYYLTIDDFENKTIKKKEVAVEERAYEVIQNWFVSEKRHFLLQDANDISDQDMKVEVYGKEMKNGFVAIIPSILKKVLEENGYDKTEVLNAWKRKGYLEYSQGKNTKAVRMNGAVIKCVVVDLSKNNEKEFDDLEIEPMEYDPDFLPF